MAVTVTVSWAVSSSSAPVTVTVWAVSQVAASNVSAAPAVTAAVSVSAEATATVTSAAGSVASFTAKVAVPPSSTLSDVGSASTAGVAVASPWLISICNAPEIVCQFVASKVAGLRRYVFAKLQPVAAPLSSVVESVRSDSRVPTDSTTWWNLSRTKYLVFGFSVHDG